MISRLFLGDITPATSMTRVVETFKCSAMSLITSLFARPRMGAAFTLTKQTGGCPVMLMERLFALVFTLMWSKTPLACNSIKLFSPEAF